MLVILLAGAPARAADVLDVALKTRSIDLLPYLASLETDRRDVPIERPDARPEAKEFMTLRGKGPGPRFRWLAAGFKNSSIDFENVVIVIPEQGLVGSGIAPPRPIGGRVISISTIGPIELERLHTAGKGVYAFTLPPGQTASIAFEVSGEAFPSAALWRRAEFESQKDYFAFFRGAVLGIAVLLCCALFALYGFRARSIYLATAGFALSAVAFMTLEAGHVPLVMQLIFGAPVSLNVVRAAIEGVMAATLILCLVAIADLKRAMPALGNVLLVAGGLAFTLPILGFAQPLAAAAISRFLIAVVAAGGFSLVFWLWRRGEANIETALIAWSAILLWVFLAAVAVLSSPASVSLSPLVQAGLGAVLIVLGFTLAHHAFSRGYLSRHFFRESGRHALALAGSRTYVWDWLPEDGTLYVSEEFERAIGLQPGAFSEAASRVFLELMHPSDRGAYLAALREAEDDLTIGISKEFRLRQDDGSYRWFQLRARSMPGQGNRAVRCIGTLTDVTGIKRAEERLLADAVYDRVSGLPNLALFADRLSRALLDIDMGIGAPVSVLLIDVDRFKIVNEALGHDAGDGLLGVIGRRLSEEAGPAMTVARLPGDQFAILFNEATAGRSILQLVENIRKAVSRPIAIDDQQVVLTASIGIVSCREAGQNASQAMKDAAIALYEAKRRGNGAVETFRPSMRDDRAALFVREAELRQALAKGELEVHYQPIARLLDMNLAGFEALVRWRHPKLGLLSPESFIGLAEQTGLIRDIGRFVLNEAGRQLGIWQRAFHSSDPVFVAVNISSAQLMEPSLLDDFRQVIRREELRRMSLKIEVTESLVMQYPERAGQLLERLKDMGVGLACDDFGTGYSSLSTLKRLPFDTLKVDRSFVAADNDDRRAAIILEAIVAMAHALGLSVVAEGIEDQAQVDKLGELECDYGQGFFIGRPMTARQVTDAMSGLPYASTTGLTAVTWLWERAASDPPPEAGVRDVTAHDTPAEFARQENRAVERPAIARLESMAHPEPEESRPETAEVPVAENEPDGDLPEPVDEAPKASPPPLGSAPMAPRAAKPEPPLSESEPPPEIEKKPVEKRHPPARRKRRQRKRKKN